jgi:hypothetical protein
LSKQQNSLAKEEWTNIKIEEVVFNIIPTGTPQTIWQVWKELVLIQGTCQVSKLTMEYVIFSCTQGKVGGEGQIYYNLFASWTSVSYVDFACLHQVNSNCQLH